MSEWLKVMFLIGGYIGMWIVTAWALKRWFGESNDGIEAAVIGMFWPVAWAALVVIGPSILVDWIVEKMTGGK